MKTIVLIYFCSITIAASQSLSQRVDSLNGIAWEQRETDPKNALRLSQEAIRLSSPPSSTPAYAYGLGAAYSTMGFLLKAIQPTDTSAILNAWRTSIRYRRDIGDSMRIANVYNQMATFYLDNGNPIAAMDYAIRSCTILGNANVPTYRPVSPQQLTRNLAGAQATLAKIYEQQNLDALALTEANKAKETFFKAQTLEDSLDGWQLLRDIYYYFGEGQDNKQYLDSAIYVHRTYLVDPNRDFWDTHHTLALFLLERGRANDTLQALSALDSALAVLPYADSLSRAEGDCFINLTRGQLALAKDPIKALDYLNRATIFGVHRLSSLKRLELWRALCSAYEKTGKLKQAYQFQSLAAALSDSLQNTDTRKQLHQMDVQHLETLNRAQTKEISAQRTIGILLCLGLLSLFVVYWLYKRKKTSEKLAEVFDALRKEAQAFAEAVRLEERADMSEKTHDTASALLMVSKVSEMVIDKTEPTSPNYPLLKHIQQSILEKANEVREQSKQLREGKEYTEQKTSSLKAFLEKICEILSYLGQIRVDRKVALQEIAPEIEAIAGNIVQELLCNTLKHAKAKHITILVEQRESTLWMNYQDDGIGFAAEGKDNKAGNGLKDMEKRVRAFGGTIHINNRQNTKGVEVEIILPATSQ